MTSRSCFAQIAARGTIIKRFCSSFFDSEGNAGESRFVISSFLMVTEILKSGTPRRLWFISGRVEYSQWTHETALAAGQANWFTVMKGRHLSIEQAIMRKHPGTANYISLIVCFCFISSLATPKIRKERRRENELSKCSGVIGLIYYSKVRRVSLRFTSSRI